MLHKYIKNIKLLFTIICGGSLLIGWILSTAHPHLSTAFFLIGIIFGGYFQTKEGITETIQEKKFNVDLLMILAAIGACSIDYYFEGTMLTFIFSLSGTLEEYTTNKSKKEIEGLLSLQPDTAKLLLGNQAVKEVPVSQLKVNDYVLVPKGESIPIDGYLLSHESLIDESAINGESMPSTKNNQDALFAGTINLSEQLTLCVTTTSDQTVFSKILNLVQEAQNTPTQAASFIEKIENLYVKLVLFLVPLFILGSHFLLSWSFSESFYRGMILLVVASPCALVASATPATLAALSTGARYGILFKGGRYLEQFAYLKAISFDKTGTLTNGTPIVTNTYFSPRYPQAQVIPYVLALESHQTHPLAQAITHYFEKDYSVEDSFTIATETGSGVSLYEDDTEWRIGKLNFVTSEKLSCALLEQTTQLQKEGKTIVYLSKQQEIIAYFALLDVAKAEAAECLSYFQKNGIHTAMITGDQELTAHAVGKHLPLNSVYANCLPTEKNKLISEQQRQFGTNAMVGDGINDAPALARASLGISLGNATDIAIDVADVVLINNHLSSLIICHQLAIKLKKIIFQNILFSSCVILLLIASNFFGNLNLPFGVIGHEGSTILVILNGLRMLQKPRSASLVSNIAVKT